MTIPRVMHHIWVSGDEMPDDVLAARQTWIDLHPDWEFRVWRAEDLGWMRNRSLFERSAPYSQKSDFARYEVVHRFGGVYLDTDMECFRPLDPLLEGYDFIAGREQNGKVGSAIFGAAPSHPIAREMIERLPASCYIHPVEQLSETTGPLLLGRVIRDGHWERRPDVHVFPPAYFFPYAGRESWRREAGFRRAYAAHHWGHSWKGQAGVKPDLTDLLPRTGEAILPSAIAFWREAKVRAGVIARARVLIPTKRVAKEAAQRVIPVPETTHGVPWGPGEILVETPLDTRLLCPSDDLSIAPVLALTGAHDRPFVELLRTWRLRPGMTFVDVGANVGFSTILGGARVGPHGRVFAYECNPDLVKFLQRNVEMNGFEDRVQLIAKAAYRNGDDHVFGVPPTLNGLGSLTRSEGRKHDASDPQEFTVECERLDEGLRAVPSIDLLKIDVAGDEIAVLDGAAGLFDASRVGLITMPVRDDPLREELEKTLTSLAHDRGVRFHLLGNPRPIPLDEVLTVFDYPQLLIRFPGALIKP